MRSIETLISEATGLQAEILHQSGVSGGCIHDSRQLSLADGRTYFLKQGDQAMLAAEASGLVQMRASLSGLETRLRIPHLVAQQPGCLILDWVEQGGAGRDFQAAFGRDFAAWHRHTAALSESQGRSYGFREDNFLGRSPQPNQETDDWIQFYGEQRLVFQIELMDKTGQRDEALKAKVLKLIDQLHRFIDPKVETCLLHGDLWSGNYLADHQGHAVLIDPAVYYGDREMDLAMTRLFGGFSHDFYAAYEQAWPLPDGAAERLDLYQLYHLLNHLNLFGSGYAGQCHQVVDRLLRRAIQLS